MCLAKIKMKKQWITIFILHIMLIRKGLTIRYNSTAKIPRVNMMSEETLETLLNGYDHRIPPKNKDGRAITNTVQLYIISMDSISDSTMDYTMSIFLRQKWMDSRLAHDPINNTEFLELDTSVMDNIWTPDLYFVNEKSSAFHHVTVPNKFMHVYSDGTVIYSVRISGTYGCSMSLMKYPLDKQKCILEMESYGYSAKTLLFRWNTAPVETSPDLTLPQFKFGKLSSYVCDRKYSGVLYTCIGLNFELEREYGFYIIQVYVPSVMTVLLSWVSFWINADATPARTTLGLVTVLTIATQSVGMYSNLPRVSYVKAIDVWYGVCLVFVVTAFLEFAWVNVLARVSSRKKKTVYSNATTINHDDIIITENKDNGIVKKSKLEKVKELARDDRARIVDKASRVIFPLSFIIFNAVYWVYYLLWNP